MTLFGAIYYGPSTFHLQSLLSSATTSTTTTNGTTILASIVEYTFIFYPYILVRTWFPITRFSNAGTSQSGRSKANEAFYTYGTYAIKFFYLWAKVSSYFNSYLVVCLFVNHIFVTKLASFTIFNYLYV